MCQREATSDRERLLSVLLEIGPLEGVHPWCLDWTYHVWEYCLSHERVDPLAEAAVKLSALAGGWFEYSAAPNDLNGAADHRFICLEDWELFYDHWCVRQDRKRKGGGGLMR